MSNATTDFAVASVAMTSQPTLHVRGDLDLVTGPQLRQRLHSVIDRSIGDVSVDLAEVRFLDASGLAVLVEARQRLQASGRRLTVSRASTRTLRVFRLAGVSTLFGAADRSGDVTAD